MRRSRHVVLPVKSWEYIGLMVVSLACLTFGLVSRDLEGRSGSLAGPELQHTAPHEVDACPNDFLSRTLSPYTNRITSATSTETDANPGNTKFSEIITPKVSTNTRKIADSERSTENRRFMRNSRDIGTRNRENRRLNSRPDDRLSDNSRLTQFHQRLTEYRDASRMEIRRNRRLSANRREQRNSRSLSRENREDNRINNNRRRDIRSANRNSRDRSADLNISKRQDRYERRDRRSASSRVPNRNSNDQNTDRSTMSVRRERNVREIPRYSSDSQIFRASDRRLSTADRSRQLKSSINTENRENRQSERRESRIGRISRVDDNTRKQVRSNKQEKRENSSNERVNNDRMTDKTHRINFADRTIRTVSAAIVDNKNREDSRDISTNRRVAIARDRETVLMNRVADSSHVNRNNRLNDYKRGLYPTISQKILNAQLLSTTRGQNEFLRQIFIFAFCGIYMASVIQTKTGFVRNIINQAHRLAIF